MPRLTQREYLWLDDAVHSAQLQAKCFAEKAQKCQDTAVKDLMNSCAQMHQRHFERLARYITGTQGQTQATQQTSYYQNPTQFSQQGYGYQATTQANYPGR